MLFQMHRFELATTMTRLFAILSKLSERCDEVGRTYGLAARGIASLPLLGVSLATMLLDVSGTSRRGQRHLNSSRQRRPA